MRLGVVRPVLRFPVRLFQKLKYCRLDLSRVFCGRVLLSVSISEEELWYTRIVLQILLLLLLLLLVFTTLDVGGQGIVRSVISE